MKKGQLSVFMIIGLLFIISFSIYYSFQVRVAGDYGNTGLVDVSAVNQYVESCLYKVVDDGAKEAMLQGGYITDSMNRIDFEGKRVPYYIFMGAVRYPTLTEISSEIELYAQARLKDCLRSESFEGRVSYSQEMPNISIIIGERIDAILSYEVTALQGESVSTLDSFMVSLNLPIERLYLSAVSEPLGLVHRIARDWRENRAFVLQDCAVPATAIDYDSNTKVIRFESEGMHYQFAVSRSPMLFLGERCP